MMVIVFVAAFALMQQGQHAKVLISSRLHAPGPIGRTTLIEPLTFFVDLCIQYTPGHHSIAASTSEVVAAWISN